MNKLIQLSIRGIAHLFEKIKDPLIRSNCKCEVHRELADALARQEERKVRLLNSLSERIY